MTKHPREAGYYRSREQIEREKAEKTSDPSAQRAHLGLAAFYFSQFEAALNAPRIEPDAAPVD